MPIKLDGPVTRGTKANLVEGVRTSPMSPEAVEATFTQATGFAERLVGLYSRDVAEGEVGEEGTGRAGDASILSQTPPRALLYGRVQSGKTVSMILTAALCLDNGFRVVVVLTSDNVALVRQTAGRFKDLAGPRVFAGVKEGGAYDWQGQEDDLKAAIPKDGMVLVCAKNSVNLPKVIHFLKQMEASTYPVLVLDDEADAATPDTTLAARSSGKKTAPAQPSKIYRLVIMNEDPGELGFSLGQELPHSLYVQVTATPYVLYLQKEDAQMRPSDSFLLEPGDGYCGGESFFGTFDADVPDAPQPGTIVLLGATEADDLKRGASSGLTKSIDFFILSACALSVSKPWPQSGFKHLSHTSHKKSEHQAVAGYIKTHLNDVRERLAANNGAAEELFADAYAELTRTLATAPPLQEILSRCRTALQHVEVFRVNSESDPPAYGPRLNFIVGGNILGRGLTISDLLVTYYVREAKISQMDTVWQHARMFGYRQSYLTYVRVYLPPQLAARFRQLHEGEEALRRSVLTDGDPGTVLIRLPHASRATRPNALDPSAIRGVRAGRDQVNPQQLKIDPASAAKVGKLLAGAGVPTDDRLAREDRPFKVPTATALDLVRTVVVGKDDPGIWQTDLIVALINSYEETVRDGMYVYVRTLDDDASGARTRGRLSGPEIELLRRRSPGAPSLALLRNGDVAAPRGWYPTIVMPAGSPAFVFSGE